MITEKTSVSEFRHGDPHIFRLDPLYLKQFESLPPKTSEIFLKATDDGDLLVAWAGLETPALVRCRNSKDHERLVLALDQSLQHLCWVVDTERNSDGDSILVEARIMSAGIVGDEFVLGVDEKILDQLAINLRKPDLSIDQACDYLARNFTFPIPDDVSTGMASSASTRWVARRSHSNATLESAGFRLLGVNHAIDISRKEANGKTYYLVKTLVWNPKTVIGGTADPLLLFHGDLRFEAATVAAQLAAAYPDLDSLFSESESYLDLWDKFQELEIAKLKDQMAASGCLAYVSREFVETKGCWVFKLNDDAHELAREFDLIWANKSVEASNTPPEIDSWTPVRKRNMEQALSFLSDKDKAFFGNFVRFDFIKREVHLEKPDSDTSSRNQAPPKSGWLFPRWRGSQVQIKRRKEAMQRLVNPLEGIPTLIHLIQGLPVPHRRMHSTSALSPSARDCFRGRKPTERQVEALRIALNTPDIAIIQGPPGTGKTRTIAALVQRLNDLATQSDSVPKRFLLTSYQHDAVETVASATTVMNLPTIKFGKRGRQSDQSYEKTHIDYWIEDLCNQIEADLAAYPDRPVSAILRNVHDIRTGYLNSPGSNTTTILMLKDVRDLAGGILKNETLLQLKGLISDLGNQRLTNEHEENRIRQALAGLRFTPESFNDDGPRGCFRLLNCIESSRLLPVEMSALEAGAEWEEDGIPPFLDTLAALHDRLILEISAPKLESRALLLNRDVCDVLEKVESELEDLIQKSPREGPAAALETFIEDLKQDPSSGRRAVERYSALLAATCQGAGGNSVMKIFDSEKTQFDTVIVDEAARANPLDLIIPMSLAGRRIVLVGDHRQLPHLLEPDVERELASSANEETQKAIKQSLFEKLFKHARDLESKDGIKRCVTLDRQYRMHPILADLVNSTFYKPYGEEFGSPSDDEFASSFKHDVSDARDRVVLWKSVPLSSGPEQRQKSGHSWFRRPEAEAVVGTTQKILLENPELSIGIITFYSAQVEAIMNELHAAGIAMREEESGRLIISPNFAQFPPGVTNRFDDKERLRVGTVDAFQGKEFDVVILSPVRSNNLKFTSEAHKTHFEQRKYGHLLLPNRMCVSLSRQRRLLIVVGDEAMFSDSSERANTTAHSNDKHPVPGLPSVLRLHQAFRGVAVREGGSL
jgi:hypothetical protein